jgi:cytochrome c556
MRIRTRRIVAIVVLAVSASGMWLACRADEPPEGKFGVRPFMRMKLEASSKILEGLATENFQMIRDGAQTLHKMSAAEKWRVSNDVLYRQYSTEFNREAERLLGQANGRNLDGATLAWVECTMSCVRCHKYARAIKVTGR